MSTLTGGPSPGAAAPIRSPEDLLAPFREGEKPPERFGIGIEYERIPVFVESGRAVPYAAPGPAGGGPAGTVESLLEEMASTGGWAAQREDGHVIALERQATRVTLEPGAQVELSGRVHSRLDQAAAELHGFVRESGEASASRGFRLLGLGCQPFTEVARIGWVPKSRYRIMAPYLAGRGHLAHAMMKATAGCQFNLDYRSEPDAMEKLRTAMAITSLVTALCANSPLTRGQVNGFLTRRSHIWLHTDPDRSGLPAFAFRQDATYRDYADHALSVPMLFVVREGRWLDMTGRTFRAYLDGDSAGLTPTRADWDLHLTTLFPEVRLKGYVELRGADSGPPEMILAVAALCKGILYHEASRRSAWAMTSDVAHARRLEFQRDVARRGLQARLGPHIALDLAQELVRLAEAGLSGEEAALLAPLRRLAFEDRSTPAELLLRAWAGSWRRDPRRLVAALSGPALPAET